MVYSCCMFYCMKMCCVCNISRFVQYFAIRVKKDYSSPNSNVGNYATIIKTAWELRKTGTCSTSSHNDYAPIERDRERQRDTERDVCSWKIAPAVDNSAPWRSNQRTIATASSRKLVECFLSVRSSQTNDLQNWYSSLPSLVLGIIRIWLGSSASAKCDWVRNRVMVPVAWSPSEWVTTISLYECALL